MPIIKSEIINCRDGHFIGVKATKKGILSVCWVWDLYREYRDSYDFPHFKADIVITADPDDNFPTLK